MKLIPYLQYYSCFFLFYFIVCSQFAQTGSLICRQIQIAKIFSTSAKSSKSTTIIGLLHTENESFSLQVSWNLSMDSCCQASIVNLSSGWHVWNSSIPLSSTLLLNLEQNGSLVFMIRDGNSVLWRSHTCGMQVRSLELIEDGKLLLMQKSKANCRVLQRLKAKLKKVSKIKQLRRAILQENSNSSEDGSFNSTYSDVKVPSNSSGSSNPSLENNGSPTNDSIKDDNGGHRNKLVLAMEIVFPVVGSLLLLSLCLALVFGRKRKAVAQSTASNRAYSVQKSMTRKQEDEVLLDNLGPGLPPRFTYAEMDEATNGFAKKLGEGGYGTVFEGALPTSGTKIAVKVFLDTASTACRNGFCKEVMSIGEKKHQNLVSLRGFCVEDEHRMLVYELMENGSLNKLLFGGKANEKSKEMRRWERRRDIAIDTARALAFLHEEEGEQKRAVIHCDVKPENILLDEKWVAKVSDFGLAKLMWGASTHPHHEEDDHGDSDGRHQPSVYDASSTWDTGCLSSLVSSKGVRGTLGYLAPEWIRVDAGPATITTASDVYSFGVVLLELVAGRRSMVPGHPFLLGHAFDMLANSEDLSNLLDPDLLEGLPLGTSFDNLEDVRNFVKVALWCLQEDIVLRPTMATIVTTLTKKEPIASPPFCDYFAGSSHFFDEVDFPLQEHMFNTNTTISHERELETPSSTSYAQGSWQISILSGR